MAQYALSNLGLNTGWVLDEDGWLAGVELNWLLLDTLVQGRVISVGLNTPPATPNEGECYIVGTAPTGVWASHANKIMIRNEATWVAIAPLEGWRMYDRDSNGDYRFDGTDWVAESPNRWDGGSDGLDAVAGRASLLLGTSATANVAASGTDNTPNVVLRTGAGGLLGALPTTDWMSASSATLFAQGLTNGPDGATNYRGVKVVTGSDIHAIASRNRRYFGLTAGPANGNNTVWDEFYSTFNTSSNVRTMLAAANNAAIRAAISASSLPPYTLGTVPSAVANTNLLIVITDLTGGREPCFSNGSDWLRCSDKTVAN